MMKVWYDVGKTVDKEAKGIEKVILPLNLLFIREALQT